MDEQRRQLVQFDASAPTVSEREGLVVGGEAVGPEAAECGPIALVENGDIIAIDAEKGSIDLLVEAAILEERKKAWTPRENDYASGALWRYAQNVGPAFKGAVTHPGGKAERHVYADI